MREEKEKFFSLFREESLEHSPRQHKHIKENKQKQSDSCSDGSDKTHGPSLTLFAVLIRSALNSRFCPAQEKKKFQCYTIQYKWLVTNLAIGAAQNIT